MTEIEKGDTRNGETTALHLQTCVKSLSSANLGFAKGMESLAAQFWEEGGGNSTSGVCAELASASASAGCRWEMFLRRDHRITEQHRLEKILRSWSPMNEWKFFLCSLFLAPRVPNAKLYLNALLGASPQRKGFHRPALVGTHITENRPGMWRIHPSHLWRQRLDSLKDQPHDVPSKASAEIFTGPACVREKFSKMP